MNVIFGISAAGGMGIGKAFILPETQERVIPKEHISRDCIEAEKNRFLNATSIVHISIENHLKTLEPNNLQRVIFETYQLMLTDPVFTKEVIDFLESECYNIEYTLQVKVKDYAERLRNSGNDYLAERAQDIEDIFDRVLDILLDFHPFNIEQVPDGAVIVARSMKTSDTVILNRFSQLQKGFTPILVTLSGIATEVRPLQKENA